MPCIVLFIVTHLVVDHVHLSLAKYSAFVKGTWEMNVPKGISISSAIPSIPINVKATTVMIGIIAQPRSFTSVKGRANK